jgi:hypothetical protein
MGKNMEMGDVERKGQASLWLTWTRTLPRFTVETPENS